MNIHLRDHLKNVTIPANLRINDQIREFREECRKYGCERDYHHFAFGQSPFSPPPTVIQALAENAGKHSYLPTAGMMPLRERIAEYYGRTFGLDTSPEQVITGPGSKEMISISLSVLEGALIVPTPSWVSYLPQAKILGKEVVSLHTNAADGHRVTSDLLAHTLEHVTAKQSILLLNHPHNPTGATYSVAELKAIAEVCYKSNVIVISDEIYALTTFDDSFTSMASVYPEGTIVTGGLSKDRSAGGYRFGVAILPKGADELRGNFLKVAGSTYSCVAEPIQHAAMEAYSGSEEVESYIRDCTKLHAMAGKAMSAQLNNHPGINSSVPGGAFYLFVDFNEQKEQFATLGIKSCADFCEDLLKKEHTALLSGDALLLPENDYSVRCCYVDYDGDAALAAWRSGPKDEAEFVKKHFNFMSTGIASIGRYIESVRAGRKPEHLDELPTLQDA